MRAIYGIAESGYESLFWTANGYQPFPDPRCGYDRRDVTVDSAYLGSFTKESHERMTEESRKSRHQQIGDHRFGHFLIPDVRHSVH